LVDDRSCGNNRHYIAEAGKARALQENTISKESIPTPAHLDWVIDGRAKNQRAALDLYEMVKNHTPRIRKLGLLADVQNLAAVAFSLWRAVFLADRKGKIEAKLADAEYFLGKMLTDNAIAFTQDRTAREWTFNYYIDNAWYRLDRLGRKKLDPPAGKRTSKNRWEYLQAALDKAVSDVGKKLQRAG
jgi:hypothetical protein